MQIATYVDGSGRIANLYTPGEVRLYDSASGGWQAVHSFPFTVTTEMSLAEVKSALQHLADQLKDCKTLISAQIRGLIYSLIQEEHGFRIWKCVGDPEPHLDLIAKQDTELAAQREQEAKERAFAALFSSPSGSCSGGADFDAIKPRKDPSRALKAVQSLTEPLGEGRIRIDLGEILTRFKNANSKDVLIPLLEDRQFASLEILCDHLPRWFNDKIAALDLTARINQTPKGLSALVSPNA